MVDKAIIISLNNRLEEVHLDLVLKRVRIFRKFSINGEFIPKFWSQIGDGPMTTFSVTVGLYKFIRRRSKKKICMSCNVLFKSNSNWKPIDFLKLSNPNVRSVSQGQAKSNELVLINLKFVWKFLQ